MSILSKIIFISEVFAKPLTKSSTIYLLLVLIALMLNKDIRALALSDNKFFIANILWLIITLYICYAHIYHTSFTFTEDENNIVYIAENKYIGNYVYQNKKKIM